MAANEMSNKIGMSGKYAQKEMRDWMLNGELIANEDIYEGIENFHKSMSYLSMLSN